ncbi:hypothetical protein [Pelosinus sp. UFO1]|uniref:hypothetical protein n=1 Tax=Pelosinus sp. UFO1 TaxID=484770 RepID=UPI0004D1948D|nr:hypothetical protein [Pelosinus sp. UFO1]AIF51850.1 hypothetical protein UFO1_2303 [Pelosinus sp. UFO1]
MANKLGFPINQYDLKGIDCFIPYLEKIKQDLSVVIIKLDGEREDNSYTFVASGKILGERESMRMDTSDLEGGVSYICIEYARIAWEIEI